MKTLILLMLSAPTWALNQGYIATPEGPKLITYDIVDGTPMIEGDIEIDPKQSIQELETKGAGKWLWFRKWKNRTIPYEIDPNLHDVAKIEWAIEHIHQNTKFKLVKRTKQRDYVYFKYNGTDGACSSFVGRKWGKQDIKVPDWCDGGSVVHEILHAIGMRHEQTRWDRDDYLTIHWDNIQKDQKHNFTRLWFYTRSYTEFDFDSIMLYGPYGFAIDPKKPTMTKKDGSLYHVNRSYMSPLDQQSVAKMYKYSWP